jgi:hypothetical protein
LVQQNKDYEEPFRESINGCYCDQCRALVVDDFTDANVQHLLRGKFYVFISPGLRTGSLFSDTRSLNQKLSAELLSM